MWCGSGVWLSGESPEGSVTNKESQSEKQTARNYDEN